MWQRTLALALVPALHTQNMLFQQGCTMTNRLDMPQTLSPATQNAIRGCLHTEWR